MNQREQEFMQRLLRVLGAQPWCRCWRQNTGQVVVRDSRGRQTGVFRAGPPTGAADLSGLVLGGRRLEIECKREDGKRSREQVAWATMTEQFGALYLLAQVQPDEPFDDAVCRVVGEVAALAGHPVDTGRLTWALANLGAA